MVGKGIIKFFDKMLLMHTNQNKSDDILKRLYKLHDIISDKVKKSSTKLNKSEIYDFIDDEKLDLGYINIMIQTISNRKSINRGLYEEEITKLNLIWDKYKNIE